MNSAKMLNVNLWQIVDTPSAPAWTAVADICIKSAKSYLFSKLCTDLLLSPKGKNVTFVRFSRKIFLRSALTERKSCSLGCYP